MGTDMVNNKWLFNTSPIDDGEYIYKYLPSKLWRLNNLYTIVDKQGQLIKFNMNRSQHIVYSEGLKHPRLIILKSRQQGISTQKLIEYIDDIIFLDNQRAGLIAQDNESMVTMLKTIKIALENFSPKLLDFLNVKIEINNSKETALSNGSNIRVRSSFRSTTLTRLHISEFGKISNKDPEKAREINSGSLQAVAVGNPCTIESTAEGTENLFATKWQSSVDKQHELTPLTFKPIFLSWLRDPDCNSEHYITPSVKDIEYFNIVERKVGITLTQSQRNWVVVKREELGDDFDREYPFNPESAFSQARDGTYYNIQMTKLRKEDRLQENVYLKNFEVYVTFDLGINDEFVMLFWQVRLGRNGDREVRLIDEYMNNGEALAHYVGVLQDKAVKLGYVYERYILPHDARKRELGSAKSISELLYSLGLRKQTILARTSVLEGIQSSRAMFPHLIIDRVLCDTTVKALDNYSKEWDKKLGVWKDKPLHDQYSNPADAFRYFGVHFQSLIKKNKRRGKTNVVDGLAL